MDRHTVRLATLAEITGVSRDMIRSKQNRRCTPWDDSQFPDGQQRQYTAYHALTLVLAEILSGQGITAETAADCVRFQRRAVDAFLDEIEKGASVAPRFVYSMSVMVDCQRLGRRWMPYDFVGHTGLRHQINEQFNELLKSVGTVKERRDGTTSKVIAGPDVALASIPEAYRILREMAEACGYVIDGRRIMKLATE
jgi:hypothetical protein